MEQATNPLQRILDLAHSDNNFFSLFQQDNSYLQEGFSVFGCYETKNMEKNQFFAQSPNPFKKQREKLNDQQFDQKGQSIKSPQFFFMKKLNFDQQESVCNWSYNFQDKESSMQQSSFGPRKRDFSEVLCNSQRQHSSRQSIEGKKSFLQVSITRNQKGMKQISSVVYDIVKKYQQTTYVNVTTELIEHIQRKYAQKDLKMSQSDENNVKRRAYDAINVMIAGGVFQKTKKFISLKKQPINNNSHLKESNRKPKRILQLIGVVKHLRQVLQQKQKEIQIKRLQQEQVKLQKEQIKVFFKGKMQNHNFLKDSSSKISFPFLCIKSNQQNFVGLGYEPRQIGNSPWQKQNSETCDHYQQEKCIYLNFNSKETLENIRIQGDIDIVTSIGKLIKQDQIEKKSKDSIEIDLNNLVIS